MSRHDQVEEYDIYEPSEDPENFEPKPIYTGVQEDFEDEEGSDA